MTPDPVPTRVATVHVVVPSAEVELASDALWGAGAAAVEERPAPAGAVELVAGRPDGGDVRLLLAAIGGRWPAEVRTVDLGAALDAWRAHARPVRVGPLVVRPPWVAAADADGGVDGPPAEIDVVVDPGRAFGSGAHVTTRLALAGLVDLVRDGDRVLDLGCGSGVLAVAALRLGAASAVGVDADPQAVAATRQNAARNGVAERLVVHQRDAAGVGGGGAAAFDVVVANMLLPALVAAAGAVARSLTPGGAVVLSGVLSAQVETLGDACAAVGLAGDGAVRTEDGWAALVVRPARR